MNNNKINDKNSNDLVFVTSHPNSRPVHQPASQGEQHWQVAFIEYTRKVVSETEDTQVYNNNEGI